MESHKYNNDYIDIRSVLECHLSVIPMYIILKYLDLAKKLICNVEILTYDACCNCISLTACIWTMRVSVSQKMYRWNYDCVFMVLDNGCYYMPESTQYIVAIFGYRKYFLIIF